MSALYGTWATCHSCERRLWNRPREPRETFETWAGVVWCLDCVKSVLIEQGDDSTPDPLGGSIEARQEWARQALRSVHERWHVGGHAPGCMWCSQRMAA